MEVVEEELGNRAAGDVEKLRSASSGVENMFGSLLLSRTRQTPAKEIQCRYMLSCASHKMLVTVFTQLYMIHTGEG